MVRCPNCSSCARITPRPCSPSSGRTGATSRPGYRIAATTYFANFDQAHRELLAWQADGTNFFHVLVEEDGSIVGRVNLFEVVDGSAALGFRMAERATGRGLATAGVRQVTALATAEYGLSVLRAGGEGRERGVEDGAHPDRVRPLLGRPCCPASPVSPTS